ncbi:hypothetical protein BG36_11200 [Aquamicrobium defluvii]|uniref:Uncharacterized protein n=1 Tax=Aquamicrobium defluvii TaxID=69279 RepID=A0A011SXP7_9HYPH|nr:hypothetical protein BG36_11200 [Aquamicrobium defluvii]EZQ13756.1 hypothetical protein CF98_23785 [Halopseudomonas bauzanensis]
MTSNAGCWKRQLAALAIATSLLSGCATVGSEPGGSSACPPVVEYSRDLQARAADELLLLPERSVLSEMMSDYVVLRGQARACRAIDDRS